MSLLVKVCVRWKGTFDMRSALFMAHSHLREVCRYKRSFPFASDVLVKWLFLNEFHSTLLKIMNENSSFFHFFSNCLKTFRNIWSLLFGINRIKIFCCETITWLSCWKSFSLILHKRIQHFRRVMQWISTLERVFSFWFLL